MASALVTRNRATQIITAKKELGSSVFAGPSSDEHLVMIGGECIRMNGASECSMTLSEARVRQILEADDQIFRVVDPSELVTGSAVFSKKTDQEVDPSVQANT